jgi:hypothetical protein
LAGTSRAPNPRTRSRNASCLSKGHRLYTGIQSAPAGPTTRPGPSSSFTPHLHPASWRPRSRASSRRSRQGGARRDGGGTAAGEVVGASWVLRAENSSPRPVRSSKMGRWAFIIFTAPGLKLGPR